MYGLSGYHYNMHIQQFLWETKSLIYKVISEHALTESTVPTGKRSEDGHQRKRLTLIQSESSGDIVFLGVGKMFQFGPILKIAFFTEMWEG